MRPGMIGPIDEHDGSAEHKAAIRAWMLKPSVAVSGVSFSMDEYASLARERAIAGFYQEYSERL